MIRIIPKAEARDFVGIALGVFVGALMTVPAVWFASPWIKLAGHVIWSGIAGLIPAWPGGRVNIFTIVVASLATTLMMQKPLAALEKWRAKSTKNRLVVSAISLLVACLLFAFALSGCAGCAACEAQTKAVNELKPHGMSVVSGSFLGIPYSTTRSFWGDHPNVIGGGGYTTTAASSTNSQNGNAVPCGIYNAPDAISSGSVGNVGRNTATCPQGSGSLGVSATSSASSTSSSSSWIDPQSPEYRAWACKKYGYFNNVPCR